MVHLISEPLFYITEFTYYFYLKSGYISPRIKTLLKSQTLLLCYETVKITNNLIICCHLLF